MQIIIMQATILATIFSLFTVHLKAVEYFLINVMGTNYSINQKPPDI